MYLRDQSDPPAQENDRLIGMMSEREVHKYAEGCVPRRGAGPRCELELDAN